MINPCATYRLQVNPGFTFEQVQHIVPYLSRLGITTIYLSPIMQARAGSLHGYDVINSNQINVELNGEAAFNQLTKMLQKADIGLLLDIVPNHMAASEENLFWRDLLKNQQQSDYAHLFDIDWQLSAKKKKIVYRRFFDIDDLVCVRMEDMKVFNQLQQLLFKLVAEKKINGVRIDHVDGLLKPTQYLQRLRDKLGENFYIITEKILNYAEKIPEKWPIQGTTGYEFINYLNLVFVSNKGFDELKTIYDKLTNNKNSIERIRYKSNKFVIKSLFKNELQNLTDSLLMLATTIGWRFKMVDLRNVICAVSAAIPVYRTYSMDLTVSSGDKAAILKTIHLVLNSDDAINAQALIFIQQILTLDVADAGKGFQQKAQDWLYRWQVFTGPVIAKGYEDTTCYRYNALIGLNEVGSGPDFFAHQGQVELFHRFIGYRQQHWPLSLNASSTHDTKRSEDVRARLNVLSEFSHEWSRLIKKWCINNSPKKTKIKGYYAPSVNEEFLIYQSLLGAWPLCISEILSFKQRFKIYICKILKEAKINSTWRKPDENYEHAVYNFCEKILTEGMENTFLTEFNEFQHKIAFYGMLNSLAQLTVKLTSPGVPDCYQGNEMWQFNLVDPDNRHSIDFEFYAKNLDVLIANEKTENFLPQLLTHWSDGRVKLYITYKLLNLRRAHRKFFALADYRPLLAVGKFSDNTIAFIRQYEQKYLLVVVPRLTGTLVAIGDFPLGEFVWQKTQLNLPELKQLEWKSILTDDLLCCEPTLSIGQLLHQFPVGIFCVNF